MIKTYKYRIYPSKKQQRKISHTFEVCKNVYNALLTLNINTYQDSKKTLTKFDFNKQLSGKYKQIHSQVIQNVSDRVYKSFQHFFRRVKDTSCKKKGFPRFKSSIKSMTYPQSGFKFVNEQRLYLSKIGTIPIVLHRIPKGKIKTLTIKHNCAGQWFACFSCDMPTSHVVHDSQEAAGIDVGLEYFLTLSNGETIANPRYLVTSKRRLRKVQRKLSRKKKGSKNRWKARIKVAQQHSTIVNQRIDFLHKISYSITQKYSLIVVEDLNIRGMVHHPYLAKHIHDASWSTFIKMLQYKAVTSGATLVKVNPRGTSKICSNCSNKELMPLQQRTFYCSVCGFVCHRDHNAAMNIVRVGLDGPELTPLDIM